MRDSGTTKVRMTGGKAMRAKLKTKRIWFDTIGSSLADASDRPTILALHGGPGIDHSSVRPSVEPLADLCQILLIDQCGHGRSDYGHPDDWTIESWASASDGHFQPSDHPGLMASQVWLCPANHG